MALIDLFSPASCHAQLPASRVKAQAYASAFSCTLWQAGRCGAHVGAHVFLDVMKRVSISIVYYNVCRSNLVHLFVMQAHGLLLLYCSHPWFTSLQEKVTILPCLFVHVCAVCLSLKYNNRQDGLGWPAPRNSDSDSGVPSAGCACASSISQSGPPSCLHLTCL